MGRRIAAAILAIVWTTLLVGGFVAYWTTRSVLLTQLDASLAARAASLANANGAAPRIEPDADERFLVQDNLGRTLNRPATEPSSQRLQIVSATFSSLPDGRTLRTLTLREQAPSGGSPLTIVYSGSAGALTAVLNRLAIALGLAGLIGGLGAALIAVAVSRRALRPLHTAANVMSTVDEHQLDQRIDTDGVLPELLPIVHRLNQMLARLEQAFDQRRQFLADASHELRTPVAALITTLEVALRRPRDIPELTRYLQTCLTDARVLRRLVEALLERARSDNPTRQEAVVPTDLTALLHECVSIAQGLAAGKSITLSSVISEDLIVPTQPSRLRSVIINLLSNAIEYNRRQGSVSLTANIEENKLLIRVSDTGAGIAERDLPHIFQPFYRADVVHSGRNESSEGTHLGLGLYLVQTHVKELHGQCTVTSQPGVGTEFTVELPVALSPAAEGSEVPIELF